MIFKIGVGGSPRPQFPARFHRCDLKYALTAPELPKLVIFGINLSFPLMSLKQFFYKIWHREEVSRPHAHAKLHRCGFKNVGFTAPKIAKNGNFWYKFAPEGKFWGLQKKVEYRCTTANLPLCNDTTNLPLCNDTITVLKITPVHSVSVITNFVIPKA